MSRQAPWTIGAAPRLRRGYRYCDVDRRDGRLSASRQRVSDACLPPGPAAPTRPPTCVLSPLPVGKYSMESEVWKGVSGEAKDFLAAMLQVGLRA